MPFFAEDTISYAKNPKESNKKKKLVELISLVRSQDIKFTLKKVVFPYTSS